MAYAPLVRLRIREGKRILTALDDAGFQVTAAFWWYDSEEGRWTLVIAAPRVRESGPRAAYNDLFKIIQEHITHPLRAMGYSDIAIVAPQDQRVLSLESYFDHSNLHELPAGDTGPLSMISGHAIDGAYVYRLPNVLVG